MTHPLTALRQLVYEATHLSPAEDDGSHKCVISAAALSDARRALEDGPDRRELAAEQILMSVAVFYDEHRDFVMDLEKRGIIQEDGLYRENLPLLLTAMSTAMKKVLDPSTR